MMQLAFWHGKVPVELHARDAIHEMFVARHYQQLTPAKLAEIEQAGRAVPQPPAQTQLSIDPISPPADVLSAAQG